MTGRPDGQRGRGGRPRPVASLKTNRVSAISGNTKPIRLAERPAAPRISPGADGRAERAGGEEGRDIDSIEAAARLRREGKDRAEAEDNIRLDAEVYRDRCGDQNHERLRRTLSGHHRRQEGRGDEKDRQEGRGSAEAPIGEPARDRRGDRAGNAGQPEQRDAALGQAIVGAGEQERRRRPEQAEGGE